MSPTITSGQLVIASSFLKAKPGRVIILNHQGLEKLKRVEKLDGDKIFVVGDNKAESSDSKQFGWLSLSSVIATVIWPNYQQKS